MIIIILKLMVNQHHQDYLKISNLIRLDCQVILINRQYVYNLLQQIIHIHQQHLLFVSQYLKLKKNKTGLKIHIKYTYKYKYIFLKLKFKWNTKICFFLYF
jgi:hypothetical protein